MASATAGDAQDPPVRSEAAPPAELFNVYDAPPPDGPRMTPLLRHQLDRAWRQDEERVAALARLRTPADLTRAQARWRHDAIDAIGGLPGTRTPLNARIVDTIPMDGYRIEKLIFESLPGIFVTALVYVPDEPDAPNTSSIGKPQRRRPAVLLACGHSALGKAFVNYQQIAGRLARRGYIVICWDPVGQGERSQFWDAARARSRYNLICGEHAILGNLAVLAGASLTRWMVWDGMRAVDYLLTRADVDPARLAVTGTSGGGFQSLWIGALDPRIRVIAPSAFVTALPMRMANRIFEDPDTDPEQDVPGLVSRGLDHTGLLLLAYPRPIHVSAAIKDFFPIEGTRKTMREVSAVYRRFGHGDRVRLKEGYHGHAYSDENQASAFAFLDRFLEPAGPRAFVTVPTLDPERLRCTRSGQIALESGGRTLVAAIQDYARQHGTGLAATAATSSDAPTPAPAPAPAPAPGARAGAATGAATAVVAATATAGATATTTARRLNLATLYGAPFAGAASAITSRQAGATSWNGVRFERLLLRPGGDDPDHIELPLVRIQREAAGSDAPARSRGDAAPRVLLYFTLDGKAGPADWPLLSRWIDEGMEVVTFDLRGTGEMRMGYRVTGDDADSIKAMREQDAAAYPLSSVMANHVYNALLIGRPYFLELLEDVDTAIRFVRASRRGARITVMGGGDATTLATAAARLFGVEAAAAPDAAPFDWAETLRDGREIWPIAYLLPGGAALSLTSPGADSRRSTP